MSDLIPFVHSDEKQKHAISKHDSAKSILPKVNESLKLKKIFFLCILSVV